MNQGHPICTSCLPYFFFELSPAEPNCLLSHLFLGIFKSFKHTESQAFQFFFFTLILIRVPIDATIHPGIHARQNPHFRLTISISSHSPSLHLYPMKCHYLVYLLDTFGVCSNFPISSITSLVQATMFFPLDYCSSLLMAGGIVSTLSTPSLLFTLQPKGCL